MARKKTARKKKSVSRKKPAAKKKLVAKKKPVVRKKAAVKKKASAKRKKSAQKKSMRRSSGRPSSASTTMGIASRRGLGGESAGQSGDTQGLSRREFGGSESVEELLEEGQYLEAEAVGGVEDAPDADEGEVRTREVPEDDVPEEYLDRDE